MVGGGRVTLSRPLQILEDIFLEEEPILMQEHRDLPEVCGHSLMSQFLYDVAPVFSFTRTISGQIKATQFSLCAPSRLTSVFLMHSLWIRN